MGAELLDSSPVFRAAIDACAAVLEPLGVHLHGEFRAADGWKRPKHAMVGLTALQVGLVDVLREEHGITPAGCLGHSSGERLNPLNSKPPNLRTRCKWGSWTSCARSTVSRLQFTLGTLSVSTGRLPSAWAAARTAHLPLLGSQRVVGTIQRADWGVRV